MTTALTPLNSAQPTIGANGLVILPGPLTSWAGYVSSISIMEFGAAGSNVTDDSPLFTAAATLLANNPAGIGLYVPPGTYLISTAGVNLSGVQVTLAPGATISLSGSGTLLGYSPPLYVRNVMTTVATSTTYTGSGTNTLTFGSNAPMGAQDGVTNVVGDVVLLQGGTLGSCAITAKDTGPWQVASIGGASARVVLVRPGWWLTGGTVPTSASIKVGTEGTLFPGTVWTSWAAPGVIIGTTDPQFYPERVLTSGTLVGSALTIATIPVRSATKSTILCELNVVGGTTTSTIGYGTVVAATPGYIGTVTFTVNAIASGGTKNGTSDTSVLNIAVINR